MKKNKTKNYVISWKSKTTGIKGCGKTLFSLKEAKEQCNKLNYKFPDIEHDIKHILFRL